MTTGSIFKGSFLEGEDLINEYKIRKTDKIYNSIPKGSKIPDGWEVINDSYKTITKIVQYKKVSTYWEDMVWTLFYQIGMNKISTRPLILNIKNYEEDGVIKQKEVDIVAVDDDVVFYVECKSQEILGSCPNLENYVSVFHKNHKYIEKSLRHHFGIKRYVPIFATYNINWTESEKHDLENDGIIIFNEYDVSQLLELSNISGKGAKYQIYNKLFLNAEIKNLSLTIPAIESKMGNKTYYSFNIEPEHLLKIAYVHQRGPCSFIDMAESYQRMINPSRQKAIKRFLDDGGYFPGNLIINFTKKLKKVEPIGTKHQLESNATKSKPVMITLPPYFGSAWVIDGQHRLYGFSDTEKKSTETIPVVAFVEEDVSTQAKMFIDINENQKSISADLRWDLYEDLYADSTNRKEAILYSISRLVKKMNNSKGSPFYQSINIPKSRNAGHLGFTNFCVHLKSKGFFNSDTNYYLDNKEGMITYLFQIISWYFEVIKQNMGELWNKKDAHFINHNSGIIVMLGILKDIMNNLSKSELEDKRKFKNIINEFLSDLLYHILEVDEKELKRFRNSSTSLESSKQLQYEFTKIILDSKNYRSVFMEKYRNMEKKKIESSSTSIEQLINKDESETLEFKGSLTLDLNRMIKGDGVKEHKISLALDGVLRSIVSFLNTENGGDILIGIIEKNKYSENVADKDSYIEFKDKYIIGIEDDYNGKNWDDYQLKIQDLIRTHIDSEIIDQIKIEKKIFKGLPICHIHIESDCPENWYYLDSTNFYVRNGNSTTRLIGKEIHNYTRRITNKEKR